MTDVITYIKSGTVGALPAIHNGYATTYQDSQGNSAVKAPIIVETVPVSGVNTTSNGYLDTRFDDPQYYTA